MSFFEGWEPRRKEIFHKLLEENNGMDMESVGGGLINAVGLLRVAIATAKQFREEKARAGLDSPAPAHVKL